MLCLPRGRATSPVRVAAAAHAKDRAEPERDRGLNPDTHVSPDLHGRPSARAGSAADLAGLLRRPLGRRHARRREQRLQRQNVAARRRVGAHGASCASRSVIVALDFGHMQLDVTYDDPGTFDTPLQVVVNLEYAADDVILESVCNEASEGGMKHWVGDKTADDRTTAVEVAAGVPRPIRRHVSRDIGSTTRRRSKSRSKTARCSLRRNGGEKTGCSRSPRPRSCVPLASGASRTFSLARATGWRPRSARFRFRAPGSSSAWSNRYCAACRL